MLSGEDVLAMNINNNFIAFAYIFSTFLFSSVPSFATVEVKALPDKDDVVDLGILAKSVFSRMLDSR